MKDVMLDLETMGTSNDAAIVAIGAVEFDVVAGMVGEVFYRTIDLGSAVAEGGVIDAATVMWWLRQSDAAREALYNRGDTLHIRQGLHAFTAWLSVRGQDVRVWGNGVAFDNVILTQAYRRMGLPVPWAHWNDRCYRTVKAMYPDVKMQRTGVHHNAGDDAVSQAEHLLQILSVYRQPTL